MHIKTNIDITKRGCNKAINLHAFKFLATTFLAAGGSYEVSRDDVVSVYLGEVFYLLKMYLDFCKTIEREQVGAIAGTAYTTLNDHFRTIKQLKHERQNLLELVSISQAEAKVLPDSLKEVVHLAQQLCQRDRSLATLLLQYFRETDMWALNKLGRLSNPDNRELFDGFFFLFTFVPFMTTLAEGPATCADEVYTFFASDKQALAHNQHVLQTQTNQSGTWWQWFFSFAVKGFVDRNCGPAAKPGQNQIAGSPYERDNKFLKQMVLA